MLIFLKNDTSSFSMDFQHTVMKILSFLMKLNSFVDDGAIEIKSFSIKINGTPERSRTPNLLIRSQALYPIELRVHTTFL